jgi:hypothetical protein
MKRIFVLLAGMSLFLAACKDNTSGPPTSTQTSGGNPVVSLTASTMAGSGSLKLAKVSGAANTLANVDSMVIDSAIIVLKDIKFIGPIDTAHTRDSSEVKQDDDDEEMNAGHHGGDDGEMNGGHHGDDARAVVRFKGPFLVALKDTIPVQVALDTIPPGNYSGIKYVIHKLRSKDVSANPTLPDSVVGYSIVVVGSAKYKDGWKTFVYKADINEEFKVKGDFTINPGDKLVPIALKFDLVSWFTAPDGRLLDPSSWFDRIFIRFNIKASLKGRTIGGKDMDHDGWPDWFHHWG